MPRIAAGNPAESEPVRTMLDGSTRSYTLLRTASIGYGVYQPGWRWSQHAKPQTGKPSENHIGYVISGTFMVETPEGDRQEVGPGCAFEIPENSDAWVVGDEPCTALDFIPYESQAGG